MYCSILIYQAQILSTLDSTAIASYLQNPESWDDCLLFLSCNVHDLLATLLIFPDDHWFPPVTVVFPSNCHSPFSLATTVLEGKNVVMLGCHSLFFFLRCHHHPTTVAMLGWPQVNCLKCCFLFLSNNMYQGNPAPLVICLAGLSGASGWLLC